MGHTDGENALIVYVLSSTFRPDNLKNDKAVKIGELVYFNISSLILRWEPSEKKIEKEMFCSAYVGGVNKV